MSQLHFQTKLFIVSNNIPILNVLYLPEEKSLLQEDQPLPEHPEVVVFAAYSGPPKYPVRISALKEMVGVLIY